MFPIILEWWRPADGVEVIHDEALGAYLYGAGDGRVAQTRSAQLIPVDYEAS